MTTTISLPSIKISRTSLGGRLDQPVTPISEDVESPVSDNEHAGRNWESPKPSHSNNGSLQNGQSTPAKPPGDSEKAPSPVKSRKDSFPLDNSTVDPLTLQILRRTGTQNTIPKTLRHDGNDEMERPGTSSMAEKRGTSDAKSGQQPQGKDKKKGVSFLSRIMGNKKKGTDGSEDGESVEGDRRMEGIDAHVFSQPIGYIPTFPAPPKYIRIHSHNKPQREFNQTFLAQELTSRPKDEDVATNASAISLTLPKHKSGAIWAMKFSKDGRYLAAAGQDMIVRIWQVLSSKDDRETHEKEEDAAGSANGANVGDNGVRLNAPVFRSEPIHEYHGHTGDVLDLSWSKNNFLLSSSMDKTVRLWHVSRKECLCSFQHSDFVTSIQFHPRDDRFFLAGSLDSKLRLWSIPDKSVAYWNELPDLITAVAFTPDGRMAIAGCLNGLCLFYETEGLRYHTQLHVRSSHGRNAKGSKITGIETVTFPPDDPNGEVKILVTSNDSRVRMYNARDKSLETKFKGYENTCSQIHATFSDDLQYVISGSEDRKVYIWSVGLGETGVKDKRPVEFFEAHPAIVTVAIVAPAKTRQLLGCSGDPLYDLCNPPPVTLVSRSGSTASKKPQTEPSLDGSTLHTERPPKPDPAPMDNPSYAARSHHPGGNIIITADYTGRIKIFRQDCAASKRRNDLWETSSTFSKKIGTGLLRKGSLGSRDIPDRVMSWRQSISSVHSLDAPSLRHGHGDGPPSRSVSPRKSMGAMSTSSTATHSSRFARSVGSLRRARATSLSADTKLPSPTAASASAATSAPATSAAPGKDPMMLQETGQSLAFYSRDSFPVSEAGAGGNEGLTTTTTRASRRNTIISSGDESGVADDDIFSSDGESEGEAVRCRKCQSTSFKARHTRKGEQKLVCVKCNSIL
ncbi:WD40-repeat-containing domain protein [Geopyxis carbonaria]|nr:WD40-repeat-containing domain protein [Geopyxis carbonaria]